MTYLSIFMTTGSDFLKMIDAALTGRLAWARTVTSVPLQCSVAARPSTFAPDSVVPRAVYSGQVRLTWIALIIGTGRTVRSRSFWSSPQVIRNLTFPSAAAAEGQRATNLPASSFSGPALGSIVIWSTSPSQVRPPSREMLRMAWLCPLPRIRAENSTGCPVRTTAPIGGAMETISVLVGTVTDSSPSARQTDDQTFFCATRQ